MATEDNVAMFDPGDRQLLDLLRAILNEATTGRIVNLAIVAEDLDGRVNANFAVRPGDAASFIGALEVVKYRLMMHVAPGS